MKRRVKAAAALVLAAVLAFTGCGGSKFDASAYVKSCLDVLTRAETKEYTALTKRSEEQAKKDYENNLDTMMAAFDGLGLSEELLGKYRVFYADLLNQTKYEVKEAKEAEKKGDYTVDVEIEQVTGVFNGIQEELNAEAEAYAAELQASGEVLDDTAINEWVYSTMLDLLNARMDKVSYNEKQTVTVHVELNDDTYDIPAADYDALDAALIDTGDL